MGEILRSHYTRKFPALKRVRTSAHKHERPHTKPRPNQENYFSNTFSTCPTFF
jgi:hypothetical protein